MKVSIYRYNPETDDAPYLQDYDLRPPSKRDLMVLDVLEWLKERDSTLTFRRSCREGVCGSDGMNINGANALACITPVSSVIQGGELPSGQPLAPSESLTIRPLPGLPVFSGATVFSLIAGTRTPRHDLPILMTRSDSIAAGAS